MVERQTWFLDADERGNPATVLDSRHGGTAWTEGNEVRPLVHGAAYFAELLREIRGCERGDLVLFTDWRGDPDQLLDGPGTEVAQVLGDAARRGVLVKGLIWRSHLDRFAFSAEENRHLGEDVNAAGGECVRDMRVRPGGSHHQKFVVVRHPGRPDADVAFAGGIDIGHSRRDDAEHGGDPQAQRMAAVYGPRPPWHDVQLAVRGPAVGDLEACFRERWDDPAPVTRNPAYRLADLLRHDDDVPDPLPGQAPDPAPRGRQAVQVLRTYPDRLRGYAFAPDGERSVARGYRKAIGNAHGLLYIEDQYLWAGDVVRCLADALIRDPQLRVIAVLPMHPDQDGRLSLPPNLIGRADALDLLTGAGGERFAAYCLENHAGAPVYVHAKVCIVDDVWAAVGSANVNRRSWTHDSELTVAVLDDERDSRAPQVLDRYGDGARRFARDLRLELAREHLDRADGDDADLADPAEVFGAFRDSAERLDRWHADGRRGTRPAGRLRTYRLDPMPRRTRVWAAAMYRTIYDPDGRPRRLRRRNEY